MDSLAPLENRLDFSERWQQLEKPSLGTKPIHMPAIGLIELAVETVMAAELLAFCPRQGTGLYTRGIPFDGVTTVEGLAKMEAHLTTAAELLPGADWMDAIVYGCTSGSLVIGQNRVEELIHAVRPGLPVISPIGAVLAALKALGARKLAVVTPYVAELNERFSHILNDNGFDFVAGRCFGMATGDEMFRTPAEAFLTAALDADTPEADAIFISCTGIIVSPIVEELERRTGKPVVTSNQAIAWQCREIAGVPETDTDIGMLFGHRLA